MGASEKLSSKDWSKRSGSDLNFPGEGFLSNLFSSKSSMSSSWYCGSIGPNPNLCTNLCNLILLYGKHNLTLKKLFQSGKVKAKASAISPKSHFVSTIKGSKEGNTDAF